jgi:hypothetical protein
MAIGRRYEKPFHQKMLRRSTQNPLRYVKQKLDLCNGRLPWLEIWPRAVTRRSTARVEGEGLSPAG